MPSRSINPLASHPLTVKHGLLVLSVGVAIGLRFFSDFSLSTIVHQAELAGLEPRQMSVPAATTALAFTMLAYALQRDWFNLAPQALPEMAGLIMALAAIYGAVWYWRGADRALLTTLAIAPVAPVLTIALASAWVALRGLG